MADNGGTLKNIYSNVSEFTGAIKAKLAYTKFCDVGSSADCLSHLSEYKHMDGSEASFSGCDSWVVFGKSNIAGWTTLILNDGSILIIPYWDKSCTAEDAYVVNSCSGPSWSSIAIDTNGVKGPNVLGKDVNLILAYENTIKPAGIDPDMSPYTKSYDCSYKRAGSTMGCKKTSTGFLCTAQYLIE